MNYRRFGKTELQMPVVSFGCMRSMHSWNDETPGAIPSSSNSKLKTILDAALGHGINHIETAHGYGSSERQLGFLLPDYERSKLILQTKVVPQKNPDVFIEKFEESLNRLQVNHVDLLAIHGINDHQSLWYSCRKNGCLAAARKLQDAGKAHHIGFSGHGPLDVIQAAIGHQEDGGFDFINIHWYYIFDVNRPAIEHASSHDMGVYIISPTDKGGMLYSPPPSFTAGCSPYSPILFNDIYCLTQPGVSSIGVGAARISDFDEHIKTLAHLPDGRSDQIKKIIETLEQQMHQATGFTRPDALWNELPDWQEVPGGVNLRLISWLANLAYGWKLGDYAKRRYGLMNGANSWVPGNNSAHIDTVKCKELSKKYPAITADFLQGIQKTHQLLK